MKQETPVSVAKELGRIIARQKVRDAYSPTVRELEELARMVAYLGYTPDEQDDIRDEYFGAYEKESALYGYSRE